MPPLPLKETLKANQVGVVQVVQIKLVHHSAGAQHHLLINDNESSQAGRPFNSMAHTHTVYTKLNIDQCNLNTSAQSFQ